MEDDGGTQQDLADGRAVYNDHGDIVYIDRSTWNAVDLGPMLRGEKRAAQPTYLKRTDGQALIYPGAPHVFFGESESLKSWAAFVACKSFVDDGLTALYIDFESNDVAFVERARQVGIAEGYIGRALKYVRPDEPLVKFDRRSQEITEVEGASFALLRLREELVPSLIVIDGVTECYALHGWNINDGEHAAHFQRVFARWGENVASIAIDHSGKDAERGQIGSQHKRAGLDGAQYEFKPVQREGRGGHSIARIKVTKDRHGSVRAFAGDGRIGEIHVTPEGAWIDPPGERDDSEAGRRDRVVTFVTLYPGESTAKVLAGTRIRRTGGKEYLESMAADGLICWENGPRNSVLWFPAETPRDVVDGIIE